MRTGAVSRSSRSLRIRVVPGTPLQTDRVIPPLPSRGLCMWCQSIFSSPQPCGHPSWAWVYPEQLGVAVHPPWSRDRPLGSDSCRQSGCPVAMPPPREVGLGLMRGAGAGICFSPCSRTLGDRPAGALNAVLSAVWTPHMGAVWDLPESPGWRSVCRRGQDGVRVPSDRRAEFRACVPRGPPPGLCQSPPAAGLGSGALRAGLPSGQGSVLTPERLPSPAGRSGPFTACLLEAAVDVPAL